MYCALALQAAVLRKEGRCQVSGPTINIPKKQLRAQWPEVLEAQGPRDVTAHIFVDCADRYMACAARITLTKAKVCARSVCVVGVGGQGAGVLVAGGGGGRCDGETLLTGTWPARHASH